MDIEIRNRSNWSDESLQTLVDFLSPCFGHVALPVRVTFVTKAGTTTWGKAYWPRADNRRPRICTALRYEVRVYIARKVRVKFPWTRTYKKRAGGFTYNNIVERLFHTLAHELRHVEQFEETRLRREQNLVKINRYAPERARALSCDNFGRHFRMVASAMFAHASGSCEVDAERLAHDLTFAYRHCVENRIPLSDDHLYAVAA